MMIGMPEKVYRVNPWPLIFLFAGVLGIVLFVPIPSRGVSLSRPLFDFPFWFGLVVASVFTLFIWRVLVVRVFADGIRATDGIGRFHTVKWEDMRSVGNICGFYYIKHGKVGAALMFPIFLERAGEFRADVISRTPPENPFRQFLQKMPSV